MTYPQNGAPSQAQPQFGYGQPQQQPPQNMQFQPPAQPGPPQQAPPAAPLGFQDPSRGGGVTPAARNLDGRTVVLVPKRVDETTSYANAPRPTAFFDLYVLDGGPLLFGDSEDSDPNKRRPHTHQVDTPAFFPGVMMGSTAIVNEVRSKIRPDGTPTGLSLGVIQRSPRGKNPWLITKCEVDAHGNARPDAPQRKQLAQQVYDAHQAGTWTPPQAFPLAQAAPPMAPQVSYGQQHAYTGQPAPEFTYANPNPQWGAGPGGTYPVGDPRYTQQAPQSAPPVVGAQPVAQPQQGMPPVPGWENNPAWAQFSPESQAQIWAQAQQAASGGVPVASAPPSPTGPPGPGW